MDTRIDIILSSIEEDDFIKKSGIDFFKFLTAKDVEEMLTKKSTYNFISAICEMQKANKGLNPDEVYEFQQRIITDVIFKFF